MISECAYCQRDVSETYNVPEKSDDEAWAKIASEHAANCEWVTTRAHQAENQPPYPWCRGNPTVADCIKDGYCRRNPSCGD